MTDTPKGTLAQLKEDLQQAVGELRLQGHLAGMEAKETWSKLQPKVEDFEKRATEAAGQAVTDLQETGRDLLRQVRGLLSKKK
jgi:hypothetical protein